MTTLPAEIRRSARFSGCQTYRYRLGREWSAGKPLLFVLLNPSTADYREDDPTIRRCMRFAHAEGYPAIDVVNLFAFRATAPRDLFASGFRVGVRNDQEIAEAARGAAAVCLGWGAHGGLAAVEARVQQVLPILRQNFHDELQCLRVTRSGHPQHPLYLPSACRLQPFNLAAIEAAMHGVT